MNIFSDPRTGTVYNDGGGSGSDSLLSVLEVLYCTCQTDRTLVSPLDAHNNIATLKFLTSKLRFN